MSGERANDIGITDLEELTLYTPNVKFKQGSGTPSLFIRSVSSGTNAGFEHSIVSLQGVKAKSFWDQCLREKRAFAPTIPYSRRRTRRVRKLDRGVTDW